MNITDTQLLAFYESNLAETSNVLSPELGQVGALVAAHDWFRMFEGPHSSRVHEIIEHLLSAELRPNLRLWYHRPGAEHDCAAVDLRDQLSHLAGEQLGAGI